MVDLVDADGCEANWGGYFVAKQGGGGVALVHVNKLMGQYSVAKKCLPVRKMGYTGRSDQKSQRIHGAARRFIWDAKVK